MFRFISIAAGAILMLAALTMASIGPHPTIHPLRWAFGVIGLGILGLAAIVAAACPDK